MEQAGIYVHVPFCAAKCGYCDFYSLPFGAETAARYAQAAAHQLAAFAPRRADTVYFGGGTPSLLPPALIAQILDAVRARMAVDDDAEITLELNPETATPEHLAALHALGVNRLSIGVQSCDDAVLRTIGRGHTAAQALGAITMAAAAGFDNLSADIMLGLPGQTTQGLSDTIATLAALPLTHLSAYLLKVDPASDFARRHALPDGDALAERYEQAVARLADAGFAQYEISNFARGGKTSRHNLKYWRCTDYLGIGPAAHMSLDGRRFSFPPDLADYLARFGTAPSVDWRDGLADEGLVTVTDAIIMHLRLNEGLNIDDLYNKYNFELRENTMKFLKKCADEGFAVLEEPIIRLTVRGMLVSNAILAEILRSENL